MNEQAIRHIREELTRKHEWAKNEVKELTKELATTDDPLNTLNWSFSAFESAAFMRVYGWLLKKLETKSPEELHRVVIDKALRGAAYKSLSTSPVANLTALCENSAWGEAALLFNEFSRVSE